MKKRNIVAIFLCLATATIFTASDAADKPCGSVSFFKGKATITHNGKVSPVDIESPIYNNDLIQTSDKSSVEIAVAPSTGFNGKITVSAKTNFYFKLSEVKGQPSTTLDLMSGELAMKVKKIAGSPGAQVRTDSAVCGVRGTEFSVVSSPSGDVLATCDEGLVAMSSPDGDEAALEAGKAIEKKLGERFANMPIASSSLADFRASWYAEEIEALKSDPGKALRQMAGYYQKSKPAFDEAMAKLSASAAFARWRKEDATKGFVVKPKDPQTLKDLKEVDGPILAIRKSLFLFERYYYRLEEIRGLVENTAAWNQAMDPKATDPALALTIKDFYRQFDKDKADLAAKMALYRFAERLHLQRNPNGSALGSASTGGDFFNEDKDSDKDDFFGK